MDFFTYCNLLLNAGVVYGYNFLSVYDLVLDLEYSIFNLFSSYILYSFFIIVLIIILLGLNFLFFYNNLFSNSELETTYECGFVPLSHNFSTFNVNFQNIAVLFIIFDLEIVFLLPWSVVFFTLGYIGFYSMVVFFSILAVGLWFEYRSGVLII